jgi:hypothetical protein
MMITQFQRIMSDIQVSVPHDPDCSCMSNASPADIDLLGCCLPEALWPLLC